MKKFLIIIIVFVLLLICISCEQKHPPGYDYVVFDKKITYDQIQTLTNNKILLPKNNNDYHRVKFTEAKSHKIDVMTIEDKDILAYEISIDDEKNYDIKGYFIVCFKIYVISNQKFDRIKEAKKGNIVLRNKLNELPEDTEIVINTYRNIDYVVLLKKYTATILFNYNNFSYEISIASEKDLLNITKLYIQQLLVENI